MAPALSLEVAGDALLEEGSSDDSFTPATAGEQRFRGVDLRKAMRRPGVLAAVLLGVAFLVVGTARAAGLTPSLAAGDVRSTVRFDEEESGRKLVCGPPVKGDSCYRDIQYAHKHIKAHPDWYVGLHPTSTFKQVQAFLHKQTGHGGKARCPRPCGHVVQEDEGHRAMSKGQCHTAESGEECYNHVIYTQKEMLPKHPEWYPGLAQDAQFKVVQAYLNEQGVCPTPCGLKAAEEEDARKHKKSMSKEELAREEKDHCHTAEAGEGCYGDILWAKKHLESHGEWYKGLTVESSFDEIQAFLSRQNNADPSKLCPKPCNKTANEMLEHVNVRSSCHTAQEGVPCYKSVLWVIAEGLDKHPTWYGNLTRLSSFEDVQERLVKNKDDHCRRDPCPCRTAKEGTKCFEAVQWVKDKGLQEHPKWYEGLSNTSTFEDIQNRLHQDKHPFCPMPCQTAPWLRYDEKGNKISVPIDANGNKIPNWPSSTAVV